MPLSRAIRRYNQNDIPPGVSPTQRAIGAQQAGVTQARGGTTATRPQIVTPGPGATAGSQTGLDPGSDLSNLTGYSQGEFRKIKQSMDSITDEVTAITSMPPSWNNSYNPKTANYTVVNADTATSIVLNGNTLFTLTFNAPSTYSATFFVFVANTSPTRAKIINFNGVKQFLWPLQCGFVVNENNTWLNTFPVRWVVGIGVTFFVDASLGNDANDGLAAGTGNALATIQQAVQYVTQFLDDGGFAPTIQLADGTYAQSTIINEEVRAGDLLITGNIANPGNVIIQVGNNSQCFSVQDTAVVTLQGMTFQSNGTSSTGVIVRQIAICDLLNVVFGTFVGGTQIVVANRASMGITGNYSITGSATGHLSVQDAGFFSATSFTCTVSGGLTFTNFITAQFYGEVQLGITYAGAGAGAGTTAQQWVLAFLSFLSRNGSTVPGNVAGTPAPGALDALGDYVN